MQRRELWKPTTGLGPREKEDYGTDSCRRTLSLQNTPSRRGRLPTRDRFRFKNIDQRCPLCLSSTESVDHLFFKCDKTREVWRVIKTWLRLRRIITTIPSAIKWIIKERSGVAVIRKARSFALITMVSLMWRAQNAVIFDLAVFEPKHIIFEVKRITYSTLYSVYSHEFVQEHLGV